MKICWNYEDQAKAKNRLKTARYGKDLYLAVKMDAPELVFQEIVLRTLFRIEVRTGAVIAVKIIPGAALTTKGCQATPKIVANTSLAANVPAGPAIISASGSFFNTVKIRPATIRYTIAIMTLYIV